MKIETPNMDYVKLHSHTSKSQGVFLQSIMDSIKPTKSLEVGLAYGISAMFILEKHREYGNLPKAHLVIEPYPWGGIAEYNIEKEGLSELVRYEYKKSDEILPLLYYENY